MQEVIQTPKAPAVFGSYSQAIKVSPLVFLAGQIPFDPVTMQLVEGGIEAEVIQVFENLKAVAMAAGGKMDHIVRLTVYLLNLSHMPVVNEVMKTYFKRAFPARTSIGVATLPKNAAVEIDAIMVLD